MCKNSGKWSLFFIYCKVARNIWSLIFSPFGLSWAMPKTPVQLLSCWQGRFQVIEATKLRLLPHYASCGQFGESKTTEHLMVYTQEHPIHAIKQPLFRYLLAWTMVLGSITSCSFLGYLDSLHLTMWFLIVGDFSIMYTLFNLLQIKLFLLTKKKKKTSPGAWATYQ